MELSVLLRRIDAVVADNCCLETREAWQTLKTAESEQTAHNSDYTKCADAILSLDCADAVINKRGVLVAILKQHFA